MAWSWSHTGEAYASARRNVLRKKKEWLAVVFAEWRAARYGTKHFNSVVTKFDEKRYDRALIHANTLPQDILAQQVWDWMEEFATCENGGHNAWACPYGCHTVPFDDERDDDDCPESAGDFNEDGEFIGSTEVE